MKKIIAICVCVVLLVAGFFILDANKSNGGEKIPSEIFFPSVDSEKDADDDGISTDSKTQTDTESIAESNETFESDVPKTSDDDSELESISQDDDSTETENDSGIESKTESETETETEEETYKKAEILRVTKFTSVADNGEEVILSVSGMPNTRYDIYVYYSSKPSSSAELQPRYSDGEGNITWKWTVPSAVKSGTKKIEIIGGGEMLTLYIEII